MANKKKDPIKKQVKEKTAVVPILEINKEVNTPFEFRDLLVSLSEGLNKTKNPSGISENFSEFQNIVTEMAKSPTANFKSVLLEVMSEIAKARASYRDLDGKMETKKTQLESLVGLIDKKRDELQSQSDIAAQSIKDVSAIYEQRMADIEVLEKNASKTQANIKSATDKNERLLSEIKIKERVTAKNSEELEAKIKEAKHYIQAQESQRKTISKQKDALDKRLHDSEYELNNVIANKKSLTNEIERLSQAKQELKNVEAATESKAAIARLDIQKAISERNNLAQLKASLAQREQELIRKESDNNAILNNVKIIESRLEDKYGVSNVIDFAIEKASMIEENENFNDLFKAFNALVTSTRNKGWAPIEIEEPILAASNSSEYIKELLK